MGVAGWLHATTCAAVKVALSLLLRPEAFVHGLLVPAVVHAVQGARATVVMVVVLLVAAWWR